RGADAVEEISRLPVAAHEEVLAVVDDVARLGIAERIRASAEMRLLLEDDGSPSLSRQRNAAGQAGETPADDDRVKCGRHDSKATPCPRAAPSSSRRAAASGRGHGSRPPRSRRG